jgi:type I restriction enzyme, S subunit
MRDWQICAVPDSFVKNKVGRQNQIPAKDIADVGRFPVVVDLDKKRLSKRFLFYVFNHPHLRVEVAITSTGSKVKHTSPTKLRAVKVGIPPTLEEQEEIASALSTTQQKISAATNKKTQLQDLFRTLLHELMTAKTRVHAITFPAIAGNS